MTYYTSKAKSRTIPFCREGRACLGMGAVAGLLAAYCRWGTAAGAQEGAPSSAPRTTLLSDYRPGLESAQTRRLINLCTPWCHLVKRACGLTGGWRIGVFHKAEYWRALHDSTWSFSAHCCEELLGGSWISLMWLPHRRSSCSDGNAAPHSMTCGSTCIFLGSNEVPITVWQQIRNVISFQSWFSKTPVANDWYIDCTQDSQYYVVY